jgi:hypothetical protein
VDPAYLARIAVVGFLFTGAGALAAADALAAGCADPRGAAALGAAARGADPAEEVLAGAAALAWAAPARSDADPALATADPRCVPPILAS